MKATIEAPAPKNEPKYRRSRYNKPKDRTFSAECLGIIIANELSTVETTDKTNRPLWMSVAATDAQLRAFLANVRCGRPMSIEGVFRPVEILRSAGYEWIQQRTEAGTIATCYQPTLFRIDPGMVTEDVRCVAMAPRWWCNKFYEENRSAITEAIKNTADSEDQAKALLDVAPSAVWLHSMIDRRTSYPLIRDIESALRLLQKLEDSYGIYKNGEREGIVGFADPILVKVTHETLGRVLAECVQEHSSR